MKMWVATIIPIINMTAAIRSRKERGLETHSALESLHRVKGQKVKSSNSKKELEEWIKENATDEDYTTIHRWRPGRGK